jgi:hypothetical protein
MIALGRSRHRTGLPRGALKPQPSSSIETGTAASNPFDDLKKIPGVDPSKIGAKRKAFVF